MYNVEHAFHVGIILGENYPPNDYVLQSKTVNILYKKYFDKIQESLASYLHNEFSMHIKSIY